MSATDEATRRLYCNECRQVTNHLPAGSHRTVDHNDPQIESTSTLWICAGCDTGTLAVVTGLLGTLGEKHLRRKTFVKLNPKLSRIYGETIKSFNHSTLILCTAGLRALLEGICDDKRIKGRNLRDKIENLQPLLSNKNIVKSLRNRRNYEFQEN